MADPRKPPTLAGTIARKGEDLSAPAVLGLDEVLMGGGGPKIGTGVKIGTIAVTVRLDPERYRRLKLISLETHTTNQDLLIIALDDLFRRTKGRKAE